MPRTSTDGLENSSKGSQGAGALGVVGVCSDVLQKKGDQKGNDGRDVANRFEWMLVPSLQEPLHRSRYLTE
jgi:hypothetical protein